MLSSVPLAAMLPSSGISDWLLSQLSGMTTEIGWKFELHVDVTTIEVVRCTELEADIFIHIKVDVI